MAIIKKITKPKCWQQSRKKGTLVHYRWECKLISPPLKTVWRFFKKLKVELPLLLLFSHSVMSNSLQPPGLQHTKLLCLSPSPRACSNSCSSSRWCHPTIWASVNPFSTCLQYSPAPGSFLMSQLFTSGGQSIGATASASVLPMNIQDWFPLGLIGLISLQSKGLLRVPWSERWSNQSILKENSPEYSLERLILKL